jgi:hypothetical protein
VERDAPGEEPRRPDVSARSLCAAQQSTPLGVYLRRIQAKLGPAAATTATAHKIAVIFYTIVRTKSSTMKLSGQLMLPYVKHDSEPDSNAKPSNSGTR